MARKTKEEALETRNAILDAAELVFQQRGVSNTSLAEIAASAGVTRGAIYWHFSNKVALFEALALRVFEPLHETLQEMRAQVDKNPLDLLRAMTKYFFERVTDDPRYSRVLEIVWLKCEYVGEMSAVRDAHLDCGNHFLEINIEAFRLAQARGHLPVTVNPRYAAIGLKALVDGLVLNWTLDNSSFALGACGATIVDAYFDGLRGVAKE